MDDVEISNCEIPRSGDPDAAAWLARQDKAIERHVRCWAVEQAIALRRLGPAVVESTESVLHEARKLVAFAKGEA